MILCCVCCFSFVVSVFAAFGVRTLQLCSRAIKVFQMLYMVDSLVVEQRNPYYENTGFGRVTLGFVVLRFLSPVT